MAIKVIRNIPKYKEAGYRELETLRLVETQQCRHVTRILDSFEFQGHVALVFPLYGCTLLELLRANEFRGFNVDWTRELSRCVLAGVQALHAVGRVHTDVKPENIMTRKSPISTPVRGRMFVHPAGADMVLIDLGSAVAADRPRPALVCTRQYRPPEIMLGLDYDQKLDVWSCGCVIFEVLTGRTLFRTHDSVCHLFQI